MHSLQEDLRNAAAKIGLSQIQTDGLLQTLEWIQRKRRKGYILRILLFLGALTILLPLTFFYTSNLENRGAFLLSFGYGILFLGAGSICWQRASLRMTGGVFAFLSVLMTPLMVHAIRAHLLLPFFFHGEANLLFWLKSEMGQIELATLLAACLIFFRIRHSCLLFWIYGMIFAIASNLTLWLTPHFFHIVFPTISLSIGIPLLLVGFLQSQQSLPHFAFWSLLFGLGATSYGLIGWVSERPLFQPEIIWLAIFALHLMSFLFFRSYHRILFLLFGTIGTIAYIAHLTNIYSYHPLFPYLLAAIGFGIMGLATLLLRLQEQRERNTSLLSGKLSSEEIGA